MKHVKNIIAWIKREPIRADLELRLSPNHIVHFVNYSWSNLTHHTSVKVGRRPVMLDVRLEHNHTRAFNYPEGFNHSKEVLKKSTEVYRDALSVKPEILLKANPAAKRKKNPLTKDT